MARKKLTPEDYEPVRTLSLKFRKHCLNFLKKEVRPRKPLYLWLSGGVDSHVCLFAALELGMNPIALSFRIAGHESNDFKTARDTAAAFGVEFRAVDLDPSLSKLKRHVYDICRVHRKGLMVSKTTIECTWPMFRTVDEMSNGSDFISGLGGDVPFATARRTRKYVLNGTFEEEKRKFFELQHTDTQLICLGQHIKGRNIKPVLPLYDKGMISVFRDVHPDVANKPIQKGLARGAFLEYFDKCQVRLQQPFQKGDSGISKSFEQLITSDWNINNYKSVRGVYMDVMRGEVGVKRIK